MVQSFIKWKNRVHGMSQCRLFPATNDCSPTSWYKWQSLLVTGERPSITHITYKWNTMSVSLVCLVYVDDVSGLEYQLACCSP